VGALSFACNVEKASHNISHSCRT